MNRVIIARQYGTKRPLVQFLTRPLLSMGTIELELEAAKKKYPKDKVFMLQVVEDEKEFLEELLLEEVQANSVG